MEKMSMMGPRRFLMVFCVFLIALLVGLIVAEASIGRNLLKVFGVALLTSIPVFRFELSLRRLYQESLPAWGMLIVIYGLAAAALSLFSPVGVIAVSIAVFCSTLMSGILLVGIPLKL
jgi:hypothetical protein